MKIKLKLSVREKECNRPGQTNITNSAEEKWALLDKDIEMADSETENENGNGRTILHHTISLHYNVMCV